MSPGHRHRKRCRISFFSNHLAIERHIYESLKFIADPPNVARIWHHERRIGSCMYYPEFGNILLKVLLVDKHPQPAAEVRQLAAIILQKYLLTHWDRQELSKKEIHDLKQRQKETRKALGSSYSKFAEEKLEGSFMSLIAEVAAFQSFPEEWPELFSTMIRDLRFELPSDEITAWDNDTHRHRMVAIRSNLKLINAMLDKFVLSIKHMEPVEILLPLTLKVIKSLSRLCLLRPGSSEIPEKIPVRPSSCFQIEATNLSLAIHTVNRLLYVYVRAYNRASSALKTEDNRHNTTGSRGAKSELRKSDSNVSAKEKLITEFLNVLYDCIVSRPRCIAALDMQGMAEVGYRCYKAMLIFNQELKSLSRCRATIRTIFRCMWLSLNAFARRHHVRSMERTWRPSSIQSTVAMPTVDCIVRLSCCIFSWDDEAAAFAEELDLKDAISCLITFTMLTDDQCENCWEYEPSDWHNSLRGCSRKLLNGLAERADVKKPVLLVFCDAVGCMIETFYVAFTVQGTRRGNLPDKWKILEAILFCLQADCIRREIFECDHDSVYQQFRKYVYDWMHQVLIEDSCPLLSGRVIQLLCQTVDVVAADGKSDLVLLTAITIKRYLSNAILDDENVTKKLLYTSKAMRLLGKAVGDISSGATSLVMITPTDEMTFRQAAHPVVRSIIDNSIDSLFALLIESNNNPDNATLQTDLLDAMVHILKLSSTKVLKSHSRNIRKLLIARLHSCFSDIDVILKLVQLSSLVFNDPEQQCKGHAAKLLDAFAVSLLKCPAQSLSGDSQLEDTTELLHSHLLFMAYILLDPEIEWSINMLRLLLRQELLAKLEEVCKAHYAFSGDITQAVHNSLRGLCYRTLQLHSKMQTRQVSLILNQTYTVITSSIDLHSMDTSCSSVDFLIVPYVFLSQREGQTNALVNILRVALSKTFTASVMSDKCAVVTVFAIAFLMDIRSAISLLADLPGPQTDSAIDFILEEMLWIYPHIDKACRRKVIAESCCKLLDMYLKTIDARDEYLESPVRNCNLLTLAELKSFTKMVNGDILPEYSHSTSFDVLADERCWSKIPVYAKLFKIVLCELSYWMEQKQRLRITKCPDKRNDQTDEPQRTTQSNQNVSMIFKIANLNIGSAEDPDQSMPILCSDDESNADFEAKQEIRRYRVEQRRRRRQFINLDDSDSLLPSTLCSFDCERMRGWKDKANVNCSVHNDCEKNDEDTSPETQDSHTVANDVLSPFKRMASSSPSTSSLSSRSSSLSAHDFESVEQWHNGSATDKSLFSYIPTSSSSSSSCSESSSDDDCAVNNDHASVNRARIFKKTVLMTYNPRPGDDYLPVALSCRKTQRSDQHVGGIEVGGRLEACVHRWLDSADDERRKLLSKYCTRRECMVAAHFGVELDPSSSSSSSSAK